MKNLICDSDTLVLQEELVVSSASVDTNQAFAGLESQIIGNLYLSVVNSASGRPVSHALISIDDIGKTAVCGPCGKVSLNDLNSGKYLGYYFTGFHSPNHIIKYSCYRLL
ncbi:MAG: hypothetical protein HQ491_10850 [Bacteroidetes bacterium]|nr:hypothetical protein [Bacteroidota bacterium]